MSLRIKDPPPKDDKAERKARRAARRAEREARASTSSSAPRDGPYKYKKPLPQEWGWDESSVPPKGAHKRSRSEEEQEEAFAERLHSAHEADAGVGFRAQELEFDTRSWRDSTSFTYGSAAARALGRDGKKPVEHMTDDEYAEYVRAGIWRIKHAEEIQRREAAEAARKAKKAADEAEAERIRKFEKERDRKRKEMERGLKEKEKASARETYAARWKRLLYIKPSAENAQDLRQTDFPWPIYPHIPFPPLSWPATDDLSATAVTSFLLSHLPQPDERKQALRRAVLSYHPDRFDRLLERLEKDEERERMRELGLRTSQILNDLIKVQADQEPTT